MRKRSCYFSIVVLIFLLCYVIINNKITKINVQASQEVNVCSYGAKGDGITDDTQAIIAAIEENKGKEIYFPAGVYIVGEKVKIYSDTVIRGEGIKTKIIAAAGKNAGTEVFQIYEESNIRIDDICISGNSQINNGEQYSDQDGIHLFDMWKVENVEINGCYFIDNVYCAIRIFGGKKVTVSDTCFLNVDCGVLALGNNDVSELTVKQCYFKGHTYSEAISLYGSGKYKSIDIFNNVIEDKTYGHGILLSDTSVNEDIFINNNMVSNCAVAISAFKVNGGIISNNKINGTTNGRGIEVYDCKNVQVKNNVIADTHLDSITIKKCDYSIFSENEIFITSHAKNRDMTAIKVLEECQEVTLCNNWMNRVEESENIYGISIKGFGDISVYSNELNELPIYINPKSQGISYSK